MPDNKNAISQLNNIIGQIKMLYQEEKRLLLEKAQFTSKMGSLDKVYREQKVNNLLSHAEWAAIFLEGILAYRAAKFIFEFLLGIRLNSNYSNIIYLLGSIVVAYLIVKGAIGMLMKTKNEGNSKIASFLILLLLPIVNIAAHWFSPDDKSGFIYIVIAVISIIVNVAVVYTIGSSDYHKGENLIQVENLTMRYKEIEKREKNMYQELKSKYNTFHLLANEIDAENSKKDLPTDINKVFFAENRVILNDEKLKTIYENDEFVKWWQKTF